MENNFEKEISQFMKDETASVEASEFLKRKIDCRINAALEEEEKKENFIMKKFNAKKAALIAAAFCVVSSATIYASSQMGGLFSTSAEDTNIVTEYDAYSETEEAFGHGNLRVPEKIGDFTFTQMSIETTHRMDDEFNETGSYKSFSASYEDKDGDHLSLSICEDKDWSEDLRFAPTAETKLGGMKVKFNLDTYKWVPEDYKLTEEDKKREAEGHFFISCGADDISEQSLCSASWSENGLTYSITNMKDKAYTPEEFYSLVDDVMQSE